MAQLTDPWGLDISVPEDPTEADLALQRCLDLIEAYVTFAPDAADKLMAALSPPAAPLSLITAACLLVQVHTHTDRERAAGIVTQLTAPGAIELNQREAAHLEALRFLVAGQNDRAADVWIAIVDRWPTDLLATRLGHFVCFNRGRLADMMRLVDRSIAAWDDLPFRSYLDGMRAFTLEEQGQYREAERLARGAVEAEHTDLWSVHAVAHVLEMEARTADGLAWFEGRDADLVGSFARHLWWHHAIIHLRTGDHDRLLDIYDRHVQPGPALDGLSLTNAIDGLARLEFSGVDVGDRWHSLVDGARYRLGYHDHPFNDSHYAYALARAGQVEAVGVLLEGMADWQDRETTAAGVITEVGLDTARAMAALGSGDSSTAAELLTRSRAERWMLGGSHAQRRLFELAESYARSR